MDLDVFLQVIGCGIYNPELDDLLLTGVEGGGSGKKIWGINLHKLYQQKVVCE